MRALHHYPKMKYAMNAPAVFLLIYLCLPLPPPEEEEEEEFVESLPVDMMDEDDLEQIREMAKKASFITRDLSSW